MKPARWSRFYASDGWLIGLTTDGRAYDGHTSTDVIERIRNL